MQKFEYVDDDNGRKSSWKFAKFDQYIDLYGGYVDVEDGIKFADDMKQVWVYPSGSINIGFVNGAECSNGTHIRAVRQEINSSVAEFLSKKHKIDIAPRGVDNKYSMFICIDVTNPAYNSQTKEELTSAYQSAINEAIEANNGVIDQRVSAAIQEAINAVNTQISVTIITKIKLFC